MEKAPETPCRKRKQRSFLFDEIFTEDDLLMEWPCQDATASGKESDEIDNDEQLSGNEAGNFLGGNAYQNSSMGFVNQFVKIEYIFEIKKYCII